MDSVLQTTILTTLLTDLCTATEIKDPNKRWASMGPPFEHPAFQDRLVCKW